MLTLWSLEGEPGESIARRIFSDWNVGARYKGSGVLIVIVKDEARAFIEVGDPLSVYLSASRQELLLSGDVRPALERGDYETAIRDGLFGLKAYIGGLPASLAPVDPAVPPIDNILLVAAFILIRMLFGGLLGEMAGSKSVVLGMFYGAIFGIYANLAIGEPDLGYIFWYAAIFAALGLLVDWALSEHVAHRMRAGLRHRWVFGSVAHRRRI